ncbi:MAG: hypothetical protein ACK4WH_15360 [Phycisphaerales bacterium]
MIMDTKSLLATLLLVTSAGYAQYDPLPACTPPEPVGCSAWTLIGRGLNVVLAMKIEEVKTVHKKGR